DIEARVLRNIAILRPRLERPLWHRPPRTGADMRASQRIAFVILGSGLFLTLPARQAWIHGEQRGSGGGPSQMEVWAPLPEKGTSFIPPNKPVTKIAALLAKHKGEQTWTETIVSDNLFHGDYSMETVGDKPSLRFEVT